HRFVAEPDGTTTLYVGAENWPAPVPLIHKGNIWYFDGAAAKQEILYRRVGKNEVSAIRVCMELAMAEKEYFDANRVYAARIMSDEGQKNGLYWSGEPRSPIGPMIAHADATVTSAASMPFRGYYYRVLSDQGKGADGGAKSYLVDGKMTGGFAVIA